MARAPKPWLNDPDWPARQRARAAARRASWPPAKDAAEAGIRALQPHGGDSHRILVFIRCGKHRGRHRNLAWVCATDDGPVFWSVITWGAPERREIEKDQIRRMLSGSWPGERELVERNRALLRSQGYKLEPPRWRLPDGLRPGTPRTPNRRDVFDLLDFPGAHPELEVRCRVHPSNRPGGIAIVDRAALMERVRAAPSSRQPLTLWVHP